MHAIAEVEQIIKQSNIALSTKYGERRFKMCDVALDRALARALSQSDGMVIHDFFKLLGLNHAAHQLLHRTVS